MCSSDVIGNNAPGTTTSSGGTSSGGSGSLGLSGGLVSSVPGTNTTGTIVNRTDANVYTDGGTGRTPGGVSWHDSFSVNGKCYISTTFDHDAGNLTVNTPYGQKTVREIDSAQAANGRPNRGSNPIYNDVQCGNGPANNAGDEDIGQCPGRVDQGQAGCNRIGPMWELDELFQTNDNQPSITFQNGDFLSIHYDSSHDPDDLQAMIAAREILDTMPALQEGSDYITVNGTRKISHSTNISGSTNYMRTMFPSGLDASTAVGSGSFTTATVQQVATLWESTIRFGGTVFVAEGGPSDFSAAVVREILKRKNVVGIKNRIRIVQHSHGWNEDNTETEALSLLQNMVTYIQIDNGNGGGQTPDWNSGTGDAAFRARAVASQYGSQWVTAFDRIDDRVDFSDGVELFEIFGISPSEALTPAAFADKYF